MRVLVNSQPINTVRLSIFTALGYVTRSRSVIVSLNVADQLYVTAPTGGMYHSATFTELRLF